MHSAEGGGFEYAGCVDGHDGGVWDFFKEFFHRAEDKRSAAENGSAPVEQRPANAQLRATQDVVPKTVEAISTSIKVSSAVADSLAPSLVTTIKDLAVGDYKSAAAGAPFILMPGGGHLNLSEAKNLVGGWSKGTLNTMADSLRYHFAEHGTEVGAKNVWQYMRKAAGFKQNLKGASKASLENGATRYTKKGQYIILDRDKRYSLMEKSDDRIEFSSED